MQSRTRQAVSSACSPQLSSELQQHPELLNATDSQLLQGLMEGNYSLPNTSTLLEQLDTIDNAACGWTRFMSKVSGVRQSPAGCSRGWESHRSTPKKADSQ